MRRLSVTSGQVARRRGCHHHRRDEGWYRLNSLCVKWTTVTSSCRTRDAVTSRNITQVYQPPAESGERSPLLPYIVIIIDEFGDLIMTAGKEVELPICRIAQLVRWVSMPSSLPSVRTTNIITGTIKANFPARVAFRVGFHDGLTYHSGPSGCPAYSSVG